MGLANVVVMNTGVRPVILHTSSSRPISTVEFIRARVPVISEPSRFPNIFQFKLQGGTIPANVVTRLSLDELNAGIIETVSVL